MEKIKGWFKVWKDFNISDYKNDFKKSNWKSVFLLLTIIYALYPTIINYAHSKKSCYLIFDFNSHGKYWSIFITVLLLISVKKICEILYNHLVPSILSVILIFILYLSPYFIENNSTFYFIKYSLWNTFDVRFIQIILYLIIIYFIPFKLFIRTKPQERNYLSLIDDSSKATEDLYIRGKFILHLVQHLKNTRTNSSFSIGINGGWGSGKTNVIERIKTELKNDPKNIIININPWQQNGISNTITTFFDTLKDKFSFQGNSITIHLNNYYNYILKENYSNDFINLLSHILRLNQKGNNDHKIISELIDISNKKIFVFIDDIDRLTGPEIIDIFSFIRTTASFNNTFFIVPYDRNYVVRVLKKSQSTHNESEYLKKIFQLEINLPEFKKTFYVNEIKNYLTFGIDQNSSDIINSTIDKIVNKHNVRSVEEKINPIENDYFEGNLFESLIGNIRELKRFCNSMKILISNIEFEADLYDLIILELIKNKDINLYNQIRNKQILDIPMLSTNPEIYVLNVERLNTLTSNSALIEAVNLLFPTNFLEKQSRSLIYPRNYFLYFSYQLFDRIKLKEFSALFTLEEIEVISMLKKWLSEKIVESELYTIISDPNFITDFTFFKVLNSSILQIGDSIDFRWISLVKNRLSNTTFYNNLNNDYKILFNTHIAEIYKNKNINPYFKAEILLEINYQMPSLYKLLGLGNIKDLIESLFQEYSTSRFVTYKQCNIFYMLLPTENQGKIIPNLKLCEIYKTIIMSNHSVSQTYILRFLRDITLGPQTNLSKIEVVFDPWVKNIFPIINEFKDFLISLSPIEKENEKLEEFECVKQIILENLDQYNFDLSFPRPLMITNVDQISILIKLFRKNKY
ncbi:KAP family P-loop NTPase fold protein [Aquirufa beregesia]